MKDCKSYINGKCLLDNSECSPSFICKKCVIFKDDDAKLKLFKIETAIRDYHYSLDIREHGGLAQTKSFIKICEELGLYWQQGKEYELRKGLKS